MKPNLFCHALPEDWSNPYEVQLCISPEDRVKFNALSRGEEGCKKGVVVFDQLSKAYWAVRRFPCFSDSYDCCCAAQARQVRGPNTKVRWPGIKFPEPELESEPEPEEEE